jgi:hypothetical protein
MLLQVGDHVEVTRDARWLWRSVKVKTPGVVTAVRGDRYTVAFTVADAPDTAVVIRGLGSADLIKV